MAVLLRRERHPELLGFPDAETRVSGPELKASVWIGPQAEHLSVETPRAFGILSRDSDEVEFADHDRFLLADDDVFDRHPAWQRLRSGRGRNRHPPACRRGSVSAVREGSAPR